MSCPVASVLLPFYIWLIYLRSPTGLSIVSYCICMDLEDKELKNAIATIA